MKFSDIKTRCRSKIRVDGNVECMIMRKVVSGLGGCLCKAENCTKIAHPGKNKKEMKRCKYFQVLKLGDITTEICDKKPVREYIKCPKNTNKHCYIKSRPAHDKGKER